LRPDIVRAATDRFLQNGFDGTSMRDIASAAGTTQAMLYRHFPTKASLFRETVVSPFHSFVEEFLNEARTSSTEELPNRELLLRFTERTLDLTVENRRLLLALVAAREFSSHAVGDELAGVGSTLSDLIAEMERERSARAWDEADVPLAFRASVAMILGIGLFGEWLFPDGDAEPGHPERSHLVAKLVEFQLAALDG
jgi:AcrR family transcriptional regulator